MLFTKVRVEDALLAARKLASEITGQCSQSANGLFSNVYVGKTEVVKVNVNAYADAYLDYVKAIRPIMGVNKHVPVIKQAYLFDDGINTTAAYRMEKLTSVEGREFADRFATTLKGWMRLVKAPTTQWQQVVNVTVNVLHEADAGLDIHSGNFMLRGKTWVLTDPLSFKGRN